MIAADAGCIVSLIKNLELQLSLADVEGLNLSSGHTLRRRRCHP
jgi:hypothetical protein